MACLDFARETGLYPVCRSGGHSTAGFSANDEMIIDMSGICHVLVDPEARTARIGSGANFGQIDAMLDFYGLHVPGGGCPSVAVGGYMQGGGYGFTSLLYGMNCDKVRSAQLALADGRIVTASPSENRDLFWAIRGGTGNNFGVLLEATYELQPLKRLFGFGIVWPLDSAAAIASAVEALGIWQTRYTGDAAPEGMGHQALFAYLDGVPSVVLRGMYDGPKRSCRDALAPLIATLADPKKQIDIWKEGTYRELNGYLLSYPTELPSVPMSTRVEVSSRIIADDHRASGLAADRRAVSQDAGREQRVRDGGLWPRDQFGRAHGHRVLAPARVLRPLHLRVLDVRARPGTVRSVRCRVRPRGHRRSRTGTPTRTIRTAG